MGLFRGEYRHSPLNKPITEIEEVREIVVATLVLLLCGFAFNYLETFLSIGFVNISSDWEIQGCRMN